MPIEIADSLELHVAELVNAARAEAGLPPVHVEVHLNSAAQGHSDWMSGGGGLSHTGAGGSTPSERVGDAEFPLQGGGGRLTENVAVKGIDGPPGQGDIEAMHGALMGSASHQANILDPDVDYLGIGLSTGQIEAGGTMQDALFLTQNFASTSQPVLVQEVVGGQAVLTTYIVGEPVPGSSQPIEEEDEDEEDQEDEDGTPGEDEDEDQPHSGSGGGCFVATAAYGDRLHPDVVILRRLRDEILVHNLAGRVFIRVYWTVGPPLARQVHPAAASGRMSRHALRPVVALAARALEGQPRRQPVMLAAAWSSGRG